MARKPLLEKLTSQRAEMKAATDAGQTIVYGYLRAKDSGTAKAGTLYYVGIGNNPYRPFEEHTRGGRRDKAHNVPVPSDARRVRLLGVFSTRDEAAVLEVALIARFGRKGMDEGGSLLNRTVGGEGVVGVPFSEARRLELNQATADKLQISLDQYRALTDVEISRARARFASGLKGVELLGPDRRIGRSLATFAGKTHSQASRQKISEKKKGIPMKEEVKAALSLAMKGRPSPLRGRSLPVETRGKMSEARKGTPCSPQKAEAISRAKRVKTAERIGIPVDICIELAPKQLEAVCQRFRRGKRGAALLEGLI